MIRINDSFQPSSLLSFFLPFLSLLSIYPSFLPSFHWGLHYSSITQHPPNSSFLSSPLETYQDIFYFQALKKNQLWPQVPTKRKKFTKKIHGYCLQYQWILNKALLFPPRIESSTLLFSRAISTILSWGYQKRMFTFL